MPRHVAEPARSAASSRRAGRTTAELPFCMSDLSAAQANVAWGSPSRISVPETRPPDSGNASRAAWMIGARDRPHSRLTRVVWPVILFLHFLKC